MACMILKNCTNCSAKYTGFIDDDSVIFGVCPQCKKKIKALAESKKLEAISGHTIK